MKTVPAARRRRGYLRRTIVLRFLSFAVRSTTVLGLMAALFFSTTVTAGVMAYTATARVATLSGQLAAAAATHRKDVFKTKAKGRLRRTMVAVPVIGTGVAVAFETWDYQQWKKENPEGTASDYGCEVYNASVEVMDEVLQELPESVRPAPSTIEKLLPECAAGVD